MAETRSRHVTDHLQASSTVDRATGRAVKRMVQRSLKRVLRRSRQEATTPERPWSSAGRFGLRVYGSEAEYIEHQRSKLDLRSDFVADVDKQLERVLAERLPDNMAGRSVLCLAARLGGEVRAFRAAGAFAVGIDLNAGADNPWVLPGNFHALDFADDSVDVVYTNSLDHAFDLPKVAAEVARVVKSGGTLILEVGLGGSEGGEFGRWEATSWERVGDVVDVFTDQGFVVDGAAADFDEPWPGQQVTLRNVLHE